MRHRHPLPTAAPAGCLVMVVICARRHGLFANLTRFVAGRPLTGAETDARQWLLRLEAPTVDPTRPAQEVGGRPRQLVLVADAGRRQRTDPSGSRER